MSDWAVRAAKVSAAEVIQFNRGGRCMKDNIRAAERGDRAMAKYLVGVAADCLSRGISLDDDLARWVGTCLAQIAEGVDPGRAMGISGPGKPPVDDDGLIMRSQCFLEVERLLAQGRINGRDGNRRGKRPMKVLAAIDEVAAHYKLSVETVKKYRFEEKTKFKKLVESMEGNFKESLEFIVDPWSSITRTLAAIEAIPKEELIKIGKAAAARRRGEQ